jgi:uncharacterized membrane protein
MAATVWLAIRVRGLRFNRASVMACCAFMLAYIVLAIRYANVQPYVIAALFAGLVLSESYPAVAGILIALAITFKIWPVLFVPWLFRRSRRRAALSTVLSLAALWALPAFIFGATRYATLLSEWYRAVARVGTTYSEFYYFPGQSLRGVLLRYLTSVEPPLKVFPMIHVFSFSPGIAVLVWGVIGCAAYNFVVIQMLRSDLRKQWAWDGLAFALYSLLEPYAVKSGLISLGPAALTAACLYTLSCRAESQSNSPVVRANRLFLSACMLSFAGTVIQYKPWQRFLLASGLDFWAEILLFGAFYLWIVYTRVPESLTSFGAGDAASAVTSSGGVTTSSATDVNASSV